MKMTNTYQTYVNLTVCQKYKEVARDKLQIKWENVILTMFQFPFQN